MKWVNKILIWDALRDLLPFEHLKNVKNTHGVVLFIVKFKEWKILSLIPRCINVIM